MYIMKIKKPSLLWWVVSDSDRGKRWLVKNLKGFLREQNKLGHVKSPWGFEIFYSELSRWHRSWTGWRVFKLKNMQELYNLLGSENIPKTLSFEKELPFNEKIFNELLKSGSTPEIKNFWMNIDFDI